MKKIAPAEDHYAVMGNPISHSLSPTIHALFAKQTHQVLEYCAILVKPGQFREAVSLFQQQGGKGLNITLPFKEEAWTLATSLSQRAKQAKAVNTLCFTDDNQIIGDNTDGVGLCRDLEQNLAVSLRNKIILIIGAGGAARGIIGPLLECGPQQIIIANRTKSKAELLASEFSFEKSIEAKSFEALSGQSVDIIINAASTTLHGICPDLPPDLSVKNGVCYDLAYGKNPNPFLLWGNQHGAKLLVDGIGMLVEQAAESFYLWRGVRPQTKPILQKIAARFQTSEYI